jgi:hypothetical protein
LTLNQYIFCLSVLIQDAHHEFLQFAQSDARGQIGIKQQRDYPPQLMGTPREAFFFPAGRFRAPGIAG